MSAPGDDQRDDDRAEARSDERPPGLMTGTEQWWEFLAETQERADASDVDTDLELAEVGRSSSSVAEPPDTGLAPTKHAFECHACRAQNPADVTFCLNCGTAPRSRLDASTDLFVIRDAPTGATRDYLAEAIASAAPSLGAGEVDDLLDEPPAFLLLRGRPRQQEALVERIVELGVDAEVLSPTVPDAGWRREIAESILRDTSTTALFATAGGATLALTIWLTAWFLLPGGALIAYLFQRRREWYEEHYHLETDQVLECFAGFHPRVADTLRQLLDRLGDDVVGSALTRCLLGYYTIQQRLAPGTGVQGALAERVRPLARDLLQRVVQDCEHYLELAHLVDADIADSDSVEEAKQLRGRIRDRLHDVADRFDALRARVVTASLGDDDGDRQLDDAIDELEQEVAILDETLQEFHDQPALTS